MATTDGRRARRERGRTAVIDAVFELLLDGHLAPSADEVAGRSGVSVSSIFRYFEGLEDLQRHAFDRFRERYGDRYVIAGAGRGPLAARIARFVDARLDLYEQAGRIMLAGRRRSVEHPVFAEAAATMRAALVGQVPAQFRPELDATTPARADDLVALVDSLTCPESWDEMRTVHGRTPRQVRRAWTHALTVLFAAEAAVTGSPR